MIYVMSLVLTGPLALLSMQSLGMFEGTHSQNPSVEKQLALIGRIDAPDELTNDISLTAYGFTSRWSFHNNIQGYRKVQ